MKILLFGASGQLGREWQAWFDKAENEHIIIPYTSSRLDISQFHDVKDEIDAHQPDLIINCAAYTGVDKAEAQTEKARMINAKAVENIAALCTKKDILLVHFSTDYIFAGSKEDRKQFPKGYPEDHKADPVNAYGQTKWEGEQAIRAAGCRHIIMRVSWLCGAYGSNFVTAMLHLANAHDELNVVNDQWGSPTFTDTLVKNTWKLIKEEQEGTYHYTSDGLISWARFAETIFDLTDKNVKVHAIPSSEYPTEAARPFFSKLNTEKIMAVPGVETEEWKTGLQRLLQKIKEN